MSNTPERFEIDDALDRLKESLTRPGHAMIVLDLAESAALLRALHALRVAYGDLEAIERAVGPEVTLARGRHPFGRAAIVLALEVE